MSNIKIFRAHRGEGKTKWLVEKAAEVYSRGFTPVYIGLGRAFDIVRDVWLAVNRTICPIKHIDQCDHISFEKYCFFTDELLENLFDVSFWGRDILEHKSEWYIAMSKEDFVN